MERAWAPGNRRTLSPGRGTPRDPARWQASPAAGRGLGPQAGLGRSWTGGAFLAAGCLLIATAGGCSRKLVFDSAGMVGGSGSGGATSLSTTSAGPASDSTPDPSGGGWSTGWDPSGGGWSSGWDPSGGGWSTGWDPSGGGWSSGWDPTVGDTTGPDPCNNGIQDGDETDVDCGGSCGATCGNGQGCQGGQDCWGGQCSGGTCGCQGWIVQYGTPEQDNGVDVAAGGAGRIVTVGHTAGALPGQSSAGSFDLYATRYDSAGSLLWARQLGTPSNEFAHAVTLAADGSVIVAGSTQGAFPGQSASGGPDAVVVKLDPGGAFLWAWQLGGPLADRATDVAALPDGGLVVVGEMDDTFANVSSPTGGSVFIARLSADGTVTWLRALDSPERDRAAGVALDPGGGTVALAGSTFGSLGIEGSAGGQDLYVALYPLDGDFGTAPLWIHQYGTFAGQAAEDVKIDALGQLYVTGYTQGEFLGNPNAGGADMLVLQLDPGGELMWARTLGNFNNDYGRGLDLHPQGGVIVAGWTRMALDGQPSFGDWDVFAARYDASGAHLWTQVVGSDVADRGSGVAVDPAGNLYVAAETVGALGGPPFGNLDAALLRLCEPAP